MKPKIAKLAFSALGDLATLASRKLTEDQLANMIKHTAIKPKDRLLKIRQNLQALDKNYKNNKYVQEFGIGVKDDFEQVDARVLPVPTLSYANGQVKPARGSWKSNNFKFIDAKVLTNWGILVLDKRIGMQDVEPFVREVKNCAEKKGMGVNPPLYEFGDGKRVHSIAPSLRKLHAAIVDNAKKSGVRPAKAEFIMVLVAARGGDERSIAKLILSSTLPPDLS